MSRGLNRLKPGSFILWQGWTASEDKGSTGLVQEHGAPQRHEAQRHHCLGVPALHPAELVHSVDSHAQAGEVFRPTRRQSCSGWRGLQTDSDVTVELLQRASCCSGQLSVGTSAVTLGNIDAGACL